MKIKLQSLKENLDRCENVLRALHQLSEGKLLILTDDEDRENEGDLVFPAENVTAEKINFLIKEARGLVCLALAPALVDKLELPLMGDHRKGTPKLETAFTVSIEAREGVTTGISASDRAKTIKTAVLDRAVPGDLVVPGHIFPLKARARGVLERPGHTEASVDLMRLAGKKPAAVICEILKDDGEIAREKELNAFGRKHDMLSLSIADLIIFKMLKEKVLDKVRSKTLETGFGPAEASLYFSLIDKTSFVVLRRLSEDEKVKKPLDILIQKSEKSFLGREENSDFLSEALFLSKDFLSKKDSSMFVLCLGERGREESLYEQRKLGGFLTNIFLQMNLGDRELIFQYEEKKSSYVRGLDLNLAQRETISYKEGL